jgi:hypothetical protein
MEVWRPREVTAFESSCPPQILRANLEMAGILSVFVPQGTRTGANGRVLSLDAS